MYASGMRWADPWWCSLRIQGEMQGTSMLGKRDEVEAVMRVQAGIRGMGSRKQATALAEDDERRLSPGSPLQLILDTGAATFLLMG